MCGSDPSVVDARYMTPDGTRARKTRGTARVRAVRPEGAVPPGKPCEAASDAAALRRTAAVVRGRGDVLHGADRGLTTGARALDEHVDLAHAVLLGAAGGRLGGHLRGERRGLPGALE